MALKLDLTRFKRFAAPQFFAKIPRAWLKTPLARGIGIAVAVAVVLVAWLAIKSGDTYRQLEAQTPPVKVAVEAMPVEAAKAAAPTPANPADPSKPPAPARPAAETPSVAGAAPGLIEQTPIGALPRIGADGTQPWRAYARPVDGSVGNRPRIAILVVGLGLAATTDERAIHGLPGPVSLAFLAFADKAGALVAEARDAGHEVLLNAPMEPDNYPADDPGPRALLIKAPAAENVSRLDWDLARGVGYVGIAPSMGARFTASPEPLQPVLTELAKRGLLYVDTGAAVFSAAPALARTIGVPIAISDATIDRVPTRAAIDHELTELEGVARRKGSALGIAAVYPATFDRLAAWIATLDGKGIALVPVSAITQAPAAATPPIADAPTAVADHPAK